MRAIRPTTVRVLACAAVLGWAWGGPARAASPAAGSAHVSGARRGTATATTPGPGMGHDVNGCKRLPPNKAVVRLSLKPDTDVADLISWIASITCRQFVVPGGVDGAGKRVTIVAPQVLTPDDAYDLFLAALDSVGLTVEPNGSFYRVIETSKAKGSAIPVYDADGRLLPP